MKTSLYIQNTKIQVLCGNPTKDGLVVTDWFETPLPEASVIGGVIVDDAAVRSVLIQLKAKLGKQLTQAHLVIDSNRIFAKTLNVPILPPAKITRLIESEFADIDNRGPLLYDYMTLRARRADGNGAVILATAVEKEFIGGYISLFADAGIRIASIDIAVACIARMASTDAVSGKTCIIASLDGSSLSSVLFVDGTFRMFNHTRLFQERGTLASASEITQVVSSVLQFNASEKTGRDVGNVYVCGLQKNELRNTVDRDSTALATISLCERVNAALDVPVSEFPFCSQINAENKGGLRRNFPLADFLCSAGNLLGR